MSQTEEVDRCCGLAETQVQLPRQHRCPLVCVPGVVAQQPEHLRVQVTAVKSFCVRNTIWYFPGNLFGHSLVGSKGLFIYAWRLRTVIGAVPEPLSSEILKREYREDKIRKYWQIFPDRSAIVMILNSLFNSPTKSGKHNVCAQSSCCDCLRMWWRGSGTGTQQRTL